MALSQEEIEKRVGDSYELPNNVLNAVPEPMVTVRTSTYQHAPYIKECIEGVLMQKTDFPIEFIIGEDYSTDGTREIVFEYAEKYPDIIRVFTADYNVGSKANGQRCIRASRGKYMAICEGDDYWTDPLKLQKQVDILENDLGVGVVFTDIDILHQKKGFTEKSIFKNNSEKFKIYKELEEFLLSTGFLAPCSWLFRKKLIDDMPQNMEVHSDGSFLYMIEFFANSKVKFLPDTTAVYRKLEESASHSKSREKLYKREKGILKTQLHYIDGLGLSKEFREKVLVKHYKMILPTAIALNKKKDIEKASKLINSEIRSVRDRILFTISKYRYGNILIMFTYKLLRKA